MTWKSVLCARADQLHKSITVLAVGLCLVLALTACGGSGKSAAASIAFAAGTMAPPATVALSQTVSFAAVVTNDPGSQGVNWSVSCVPGKAKGSTCGSITPHSASGFPSSYTAPTGDLTANSIPVGGTVTVTATSTADPSQSVTTTIQIVTLPISVSFSQAPTSMLTGASATIVVATNDPNGRGADLTVTCDTPGACGSFNSTHADGLAGGNGVIYTAPVVVPAGPSGGVVTITATSTSDPTASAVTTITILQAPLSVSLSQLPIANLPAGAATNLIATVNFDPNNAGVDWTVTCGSSSCGSLSLPHSASGQTETYTAPTAVPPGNTVTITATATSNPAVTATTTVNIAPENLKDNLLSGHYAFLLQGVKAGGVSAIAGDLVADGIGNITSVTESILGENDAYTLSGTYFVGSDGRGIITLNGAPVGLGYWYNGQQIFKVNVIDSGHAVLEEFDGYYNTSLHVPYGGTLRGTLELQTTSAFQPGPYPPSLTGNMSFLLSGSGGGNALAYYGGALGSTRSFWMDRQIAGSLDSISDATPGYGIVTFANVSSYGDTGVMTVGPYRLNYYIVDSGHWILIAASGSTDLPAGHMYLQPSTIALPVGTYAFTEAGSTPLPQGGLPYAAGGFISCSTSGALSGSMDINNNGAVSTVSAAGTCTMASLAGVGGRGTLALSGGSAQQFAIYPTATHGLLLLELDSQSSGVGNAFLQAPGTTASSFSGTYVGSFQRMGFIDGTQGGVGLWQDILAALTSDGVSNLNGTADIDAFDESSQAYWTQTPDGSLAGNYTTDAQGNVTGSLSAAPAGTMRQNFYVVNGSTILTLETDATPATGILQLRNF